ncbi:MAG: antitoxin [Planctomycetes bacterium]|nr:antitoxin [Planctomycetota bacterium]
MQKAKLFNNGRSQAVRLPKKFRFEGDSVTIRRIGKAVLLMPENESWDLLFDSLDCFSDDFMAEGRKQPQMQEREEFLHESDA